MVSNLASIDRGAFDAYFEGQAVAYALEIRDVWEYQNPVGLTVLRSRFESFVVPQSWRYVTAVEARVFETLARRPTRVPVIVESAREVNYIMPELS